jgi:SAM-dependent methyltransferase
MAQDGMVHQHDRECVSCNLCGGADVTHYGAVFDVEMRQDVSAYDLLQCRKCGFVFVDFRQVSPDRDYYGDGYYSYALYGESQIERWKKNVVRCAEPRRILDVGCGSGEWLYKKQLKGHEVWGLETDKRAVAAARSHGLKVTTRAESLPDDYFDMIRLSHVIEHTQEPLEMVESLTLKLRDGAQMEILVPNLESVKFAKVMDISKLVDVPRHRCFFSADTLRLLLTKSGLRVDSIDWVSSPVCVRELLGDLRRLFVYQRKARPHLWKVGSLLLWTILIRLNSRLRRGRRNDWLAVTASRLPTNSPALPSSRKGRNGP